jgi:hypothetical protein
MPSLRALALAALGLALLGPEASAQWEPVPGLPAGFGLALAAEGDLVLAAVDGVVYRSFNAGDIWVRGGEVDSEVSVIDALHIHGGALFAASASFGVYRSLDLGETWVPFRDGLGGEGALGWYVTSLVRRGDHLYAGTEGGVYRHDLRQWEAAWERYSEGFLPGIASVVKALTARGSRLVASTPLNGYVFVNEGEGPWEVIALEPPGPTPDLDVGDFLWHGEALLGATDFGMYRSEDGGRTWARHGTPAQIGLVHALAEADGRVYWATSGGLSGRLYASEDGGETWTLEGPIPPSFNLLAHGGWMYLAHAQGVWRRARPVGAAPPPEGSAFSVEAVYPNPVRGEGRVALRLGAPAEVSLRVLDVTGREVRRQVLGALPSGEHAVTFEAGGLGAGVYLLLAEGSGGERAARRVVVAP